MPASGSVPVPAPAEEPGPAEADLWFKAFDWDLGLRLRAEYDTNPFRWSSQPDADLVLAPCPFFRLVYGRRDTPFFARLAGAGEYSRYLGVEEDWTARDAINAAGQLELCVFGFICLEDRFERVDEPTALDGMRLSRRFFNHATARVQRGDAAATGWGRLDLRAGVLLDEYDAGTLHEAQGSIRETFLLDYLVHVGHDVRLGVLASFEPLDWHSDNRDEQYREPNASPLRARAQASIVLVGGHRLGLEIGYGDAFREHGDSFSSAIGRLFFEADLHQLGRLDLNVRRDFEVRPVWGYIGDDSAALAYRWTGLEGRLGAVLDVGYHYLTFGKLPYAYDAWGAPSPIQPKQRFDSVVLVHAGLRGVLWTHLAAALDYRLEHDGTGYSLYHELDPTITYEEPVDYTRHTLSLSLILQWDASLDAVERFQPRIPSDTVPPMPDVPVYLPPDL